MTVTITQRYLFEVNCYLVPAGDGFVLIDTGLAPRRASLERRLRAAGCSPGSLRLIVLTHAHSDHAGNCAYLQRVYGAPIAMHVAEAGKAVRGDMFWRDDGRRDLPTRVAGAALNIVGMGRFEPFRPDVALHDEQRLNEYGLAAVALHVPGHTAGSMALLTDGGELYCGDVFTATRRPEVNSLAEDPAALRAAAARLLDRGPAVVYPGHGRPFSGGALRETLRRAVRSRGRLLETGIRTPRPCDLH